MPMCVSTVIMMVQNIPAFREAPGCWWVVVSTTSSEHGIMRGFSSTLFLLLLRARGSADCRAAGMAM